MLEMLSMFAILALTRKQTVPPGGFRVFREGFEITGPNLDDFIEAVHRWEENNDRELTPPDEIEDELCRQLADGRWCAQRGKASSGKPNVGFGVSFRQVVQFTSTMADFFLRGRWRRVPLAEAERRANICSGCPHNVSACSVCQGRVMNAIADRIRPKNNTTPKEAALKDCGVCGCNLKLKIHVPLKFLASHDRVDPEAYPTGCWQHPEARPEECDACGGKGSLEATTGSLISCPACEGTGKLEITT